MACKLCQRSSSKAEAAPPFLFCTAFAMVALICLSSVRDTACITYDAAIKGSHHQLFNNRPCDEIYVVGEGETLHTISDKCGDPFIVEQNPHIHDPDDVFPGLVIKITPSKPR